MNVVQLGLAAHEKAAEKSLRVFFCFLFFVFFCKQSILIKDPKLLKLRRSFLMGVRAILGSPIIGARVEVVELMS